MNRGIVYYYITTNATGIKFNIEVAYDYGHELENKHRSVGNYFKTKEDAEEMIKKLKELWIRQ